MGVRSAGSNPGANLGEGGAGLGVLAASDRDAGDQEGVVGDGAGQEALLQGVGPAGQGQRGAVVLAAPVEILGQVVGGDSLGERVADAAGQIGGGAQIGAGQVGALFGRPQEHAIAVQRAQVEAVARGPGQLEGLVEASLGAGELAGADQGGAEQEQGDQAGLGVTGGGGGFGGEGEVKGRGGDVLGAPGRATAGHGGAGLEDRVAKRGGEGGRAGGRGGRGAVVRGPVERGCLVEQGRGGEAGLVFGQGQSFGLGQIDQRVGGAIEVGAGAAPAVECAGAGGAIVWWQEGEGGAVVAVGVGVTMMAIRAIGQLEVSRSGVAGLASGGGVAGAGAQGSVGVGGAGVVEGRGVEVCAERWIQGALDAGAERGAGEAEVGRGGGRRCGAAVGGRVHQETARVQLEQPDRGVGAGRGAAACGRPCHRVRPRPRRSRARATR